MSEEEKVAKVLKLFNEAATPAPPPAPGLNISVNGDVTGQLAGRDIHNHYAKPPRRPRVVVQPGVGVITEAQKVTIQALRDEWIALHAEIKRSPLSYGAAWSRINQAAGVTSYHQIPGERFETVIAFIREQMAILRNMRSAPAKNIDWRAKRIGAIKARCTNQLGNPGAYKAYIKKNFGADSLTELATDQLQRTYAYIMALPKP